MCCFLAVHREELIVYLRFSLCSFLLWSTGPGTCGFRKGSSWALEQASALQAYLLRSMTEADIRSWDQGSNPCSLNWQTFH